MIIHFVRPSRIKNTDRLTARDDVDSPVNITMLQSVTVSRQKNDLDWTWIKPRWTGSVILIDGIPNYISQVELAGKYVVKRITT